MKFIRINGRVIELTGGLIHGAGDEERLSPRLLSLLGYLVENTDRVLTRDELIEAVWGHLEAATDDSVNVAVSSLRKAIGDDRRPHRILRAIPRRGYWFESKGFERIDEREAQRRVGIERDSADVSDRSGSMSLRRRWAPVAAGIATLAVVATLWLADERMSRSSDPDGTAPLGTIPVDRAVAVLPFTDMSATGDQQPFADGLVDRIIHMLTLSPELDVVARTSSFAFRNTQSGIGDIAERLNADAILEGSVQRDEENIRVLAQLINAETELHIWSRTYDKPIGDLFVLQDQIANDVARTMTDSLLPERDTPQADSLPVWERITQGHFALDRGTLEGAELAMDYFRQALDLQPENVEALIGMVDAIGLRRSHSGRSSESEEVDLADEFLERAREIAPESTLVQRAIGDRHFNQGREDEAVATYLRVIERNPSAAIAWRNLGRSLFRKAAYEDAIEPLRTAVRLDPFSVRNSVGLAAGEWALGRAEEALFQLRRIIADRPGFPQAHNRLATYLTQTGETGQAMRHILRARELDPDSAQRGFRVCEFWLQLGDVDRAEACADELLAKHDLPFLGRYLRQIIHGFRHDWDANLVELEAIYEMNRRDPLTRTLLAQSYSRFDDCPLALDVLEESFPELFADPPEMNPTLLFAAKTVIYCLQQSGQKQRAEALLQPYADWVERIRHERGPWLVIGIEPAWVHAFKGEYDAAIAVLEELVDSGWRYYWFTLDTYPSFRPIYDDPRFIELNERLYEGVREQREWFEANRDEPLT